MNTKAQAEPMEMTKFAFVYLPLTVIVIIALVMFPRTLMAKGLQPVSADQAVQARQIQTQLWVTDPNTGRTTPFEYTDDLTGINNTITQKKMAYSVTLDGKTVKHQERFYDIAKPIAPHRYSPYTENRKINVDGRQKKLTIELYYPYKYEART